MSLSKFGLRCASGLLTGLLFGVGLAVAQMTDPAKVLSFLDVTGAWDPSLLLVLGGAVLLSAVAYHWILTQPAPRLDNKFHLPVAGRVDARLISGAVLFGVGWGLAGYCPGPVVASLGFGNPEALWLLPSLLLGVALQRWLDGGRQAGIPTAHHSLDVLDIRN